MGRTLKILLVTSDGLILVRPRALRSSTRTFKGVYISLALSLGSISNELIFFKAI
jgi:hypothetical protein